MKRIGSRMVPDDPAYRCRMNRTFLVAGWHRELAQPSDVLKRMAHCGQHFPELLAAVNLFELGLGLGAAVAVDF